MHMFVGAIFLMLGGACVAYLWAGGSIFEREPPLLAFGVVWLVGDGSRLRPCRLGVDAACDIIATRLLESAERAPTAPPTRWEEDAARVLERYCRGPEPGPCAVHRYAVGSVALRAGRIDAARQAFLRACDEDPSWCARAAQETALSWTREERARLERHR